MDSNKEIIFLDIDDTIADFTGAMNDALIDYEHYLHPDENLSLESCVQLIKEISEEEFLFLIEEFDILSKLELFPDTYDYLKFCYENFKLFFITARKWHMDSEKITTKWLQSKNINFDGLIITDLKDMKGDYILKFKNVKLFVDDKYNQYKYASDHKIKSLLKTHPCNILSECPKNHRLDNFKELIRF